jgi:hypothetical protein
MEPPCHPQRPSCHRAAPRPCLSYRRPERFGLVAIGTTGVWRDRALHRIECANVWSGPSPAIRHAAILIDGVASGRKAMRLICSPSGIGKTSLATKEFKKHGILPPKPEGLKSSQRLLGSVRRSAGDPVASFVAVAEGGRADPIKWWRRSRRSRPDRRQPARCSPIYTWAPAG